MCVLNVVVVVVLGACFGISVRACMCLFICVFVGCVLIGSRCGCDGKFVVGGDVVVV